MRPEEANERLDNYCTLIKEAIDSGRYDADEEVELRRTLSFADEARRLPPQNYGRFMRWLGYVQGMMVAHKVVTREEMLRINKRCDERFGKRRPGDGGPEAVI